MFFQDGNRTALYTRAYVDASVLATVFPDDAPTGGTPRLRRSVDLTLFTAFNPVRTREPHRWSAGVFRELARLSVDQLVERWIDALAVLQKRDAPTSAWSHLVQVDTRGEAAVTYVDAAFFRYREAVAACGGKSPYASMAADANF